MKRKNMLLVVLFGVIGVSQCAEDSENLYGGPRKNFALAMAEYHSKLKNVLIEINNCDWKACIVVRRISESCYEEEMVDPKPNNAHDKSFKKIVTSELKRVSAAIEKYH